MKRNSSASRQVLFALLVAFLIMIAAGDAWISRVSQISDINVAKRKSA